MAVKIKLKRLGSKRNPQYRIVIADARNRRDGRAIEEIGLYHPKEEPSLIKINGERAQYWLGVGAQPTQAVQRLLEITGDWQQFKGLPGAEGTLKVAEAKPDRKAIFEAAAKEAAGENEKFAKERAAKAAAAAKAELEPPEPQPEESAEKVEVAAEESSDTAAEAEAEAEKA